MELVCECTVDSIVGAVVAKAQEIDSWTGGGVEGELEYLKGKFRRCRHEADEFIDRFRVLIEAEAEKAKPECLATMDRALIPVTWLRAATFWFWDRCIELARERLREGNERAA